MLSGLAFVLQYLEFPIPIMPGFIKFDFSDLPALIGAFAYGPLAGVIVEFIKNLLHCTVTQSFTVGELSNFILGAVFTATAGLIYKKNKSKKGAIIGALVGSVVMGIISFPSNLFIVYPAYTKFMPMEAIIGAYSELLPSVGKLWQALLIFNVPFTIVKGLISNTYHSACIQETVTCFKGQRIEKIPDTIYISHKHKERSQLRSFLFLKRNVIINPNI